MTIAPELLSKRDFILEVTFRERPFEEEMAERLREIEAAHLAAIRRAVAQQRPVHGHNVTEYVSIVPELRSYSLYGEYGLFDQTKQPD
jgi:hypothetical protein